MAERAGIPAPETKRDRRRYAARVDGRRRLVIGDGLLDAPPAVFRGVLAHEIGHLACAHDNRHAFGVSTATALAGGAAAGLLAASAAAPPPLFSWIAFALVFFAGLARLGTVMRRQEFEADARAVELLGEADSTLAALDWRAGRDQRRVGAAGRATLTHPPVADRKAAVIAGARRRCIPCAHK